MGEGTNQLTDTERAIENRDNHTSTSSTSNKRKRGPGRPPKQTNGSEEKVLPGLVSIKEPKIVSIELPGEEVEKPKKKAGRPKKVTKTGQADYTHINMLLLTVSGILASRPGMQDFNLTLEECEQIAKPLANIIAKNEAISKAAEEKADAIALIMAVATIFIPKFIMYQSKKPKKAKQGDNLNYGSKQPTQLQQQKREIGSVSPLVSQPPTDNSKDNSKIFSGKLHSVIPVI